MSEIPGKRFASVLVRYVGAVAIGWGLMVNLREANGCPFCSAVSQTFAEEMEAMPVVVFAHLVEAVDFGNGQIPEGEIPASKFAAIEVLKGGEWIKVGDPIETQYFGPAEKKGAYLIMGTDVPALKWGSPLLLSEEGAEYVRQVATLPKDFQRLRFFLKHLENPDVALSNDAYDEFARAPYGDIVSLKETMNRGELMDWILKKDVSSSRRRLYLTMLGVCGNTADTEVLEKLMRSEKREDKAGLDAMVAAYLTLRGEEGLPLIEQLFLENTKADYMDTNAAILAIRFHGNESSLIPRPRLVKALRMVLGRDDLADLVIPDLARWEDWEALPTMVELFKRADPQSNWVRVPIVNFVRACPRPEAQAAMAEFNQLDPDSVRRAGTLFPFAGLADRAGAPTTNSAAAEPATQKTPGENPPPADAAAIPAPGMLTIAKADAAEQVPMEELVAELATAPPVDIPQPRTRRMGEGTGPVWFGCVALMIVGCLSLVLLNREHV